jgi:glutathione synthase
MRLAFIVDPLGSFRIYKDSTYAMMREAQRRGHEVWACEPQHLALVDGEVRASLQQLQLAGIDPHSEPHGPRSDWFTVTQQADLALSAFDAVLNRKDPPFDLEYVATTWLLSHAQAAGACIVNDPQAVRDHNEKFAISEFAQFMTPTLVTRDAARIAAFHKVHHDIIIKPLDGMGGMGIFRVQADALNLASIIETLGHNGARTLMAQRYIPAIADPVAGGDKRILLIDGEPVPFALARIPKAGETRGNLAAGGTGVARPLTDHDWKIARALGPTLAARGLLLVGLDVIGEHLTEVNVTSPTCFREIMDQTGFDVAAMLLDAVERTAERKAERTAERTAETVQGAST